MEVNWRKETDSSFVRVPARSSGHICVGQLWEKLLLSGKTEKQKDREIYRIAAERQFLAKSCLLIIWIETCLRTFYNWPVNESNG